MLKRKIEVRREGVWAEIKEKEAGRGLRTRTGVPPGDCSRAALSPPTAQGIQQALDTCSLD